METYFSLKIPHFVCYFMLLVWRHIRFSSMCPLLGKDSFGNSMNGYYSHPSCTVFLFHACSIHMRNAENENKRKDFMGFAQQKSITELYELGSWFFLSSFCKRTCPTKLWMRRKKRIPWSLKSVVSQQKPRRMNPAKSSFFMEIIIIIMSWKSNQLRKSVPILD